MTDRYAATAGAYDLMNAPWRAVQVVALEHLLPLLQPDAGPILDVGAGSGVNIEWLLERSPDAQVYALEPSPAMRALALSRIAAHLEWQHRVTVRPEDFFAATLPERLGGAILLGVLGHFDPGERAAVLAELADRLPHGGAALIDLQPPERPEAVPAATISRTQVGELEYRLIAEATPIDDERLHWRMTYLSLEGERVLTEDTAEHIYHHPGPDALLAEAASVWLHAERLGETTYWLLRRA
ncbi:MAG: class I SAM-dependent methyltransferase [Micropruina sp.]|uniref:class I SAM-dependent methyltransferase n=1 Tax=Micropruina sp. TaxID=2737536 RepID=UPI0039E22F3D